MAAPGGTTRSHRGPLAAGCLAVAVFLSLLVHDSGGWSAEELHLATVANLDGEPVRVRIQAFGLVMAYR